MILIVMDDGGHPFPMYIDGQGQVTGVGDTHKSSFGDADRQD